MSNETTLDDVLALVADWRDQAKRLRNEVPNLRDGSDKRFDSARDADCAADELEALLPAIKAALEDARRWQAARQFIGAKEIEDWEKMAAGDHIASEAGNRWADEAIDAIDAAQEVGK